MKRILLDENIPLELIAFAPKGCEARHVVGEGWKRRADGQLLIHAEAAELVTADRSIAYQQNLRAKRIALLVLTTDNWLVIRPNATSIFARAVAADIAAIETIELPHPARSPRR